MFPKQKPWRNRKYLNAAEGESCIRCGANDGTIVAAHYEGFRQLSYGKGMGQKCADLLTADLCMTCHEDFDRFPEYKSIEKSEQFLDCIARTLLRRAENGWFQ